MTAAPVETIEISAQALNTPRTRDQFIKGLPVARGG